jgi:hypothetical protein
LADAIDCGARALTPRLWARDEAYFTRELLLEPAGQFPPDNLVRVFAWVRPEALDRGPGRAKRRDVDIELVLVGVGGPSSLEREPPVIGYTHPVQAPLHWCPPNRCRTNASAAAKAMSGEA